MTGHDKRLRKSSCRQALAEVRQGMSSFPATEVLMSGEVLCGTVPQKRPYRKKGMRPAGVGVPRAPAWLRGLGVEA